MTRGILPIALSVLMSVGTVPIAFAGDSQLNFKIYSPDGASSAPASTDEAPASALTDDKPAALATPESATVDPTPAATADMAPASTADTAPTVTESKPELSKETPMAAPAAAATPAPSTTADTDTSTTPATAADTMTAPADATAATSTSTDTASGDSKSDTTTASGEKSDKTLQGYVREVPARTHIPIIMDTAVDSDTSQEGDEFSARTSEDLTIDGAIVVPAGSVIKGRIAQLNAPKHFERGGSVALKFDTVTTPDNRSIPLVANLVAHGGVVHAKRGLRDYAIDSGTVAAPLVVGALIGLVAGKSNSTANSTTSSNSTTNSNGMSKGAAMALGTGIGLAVGVAILCAKKGKKVDVRPGDELKIELAEALRMPMM